MAVLMARGISRAVARGPVVPILEDVDLGVATGAVVGVTGPRDSGWAALLRVLGGLDPASSGSLTIDGVKPRRGDVVLASALDPLLDLGIGGALRALRGLDAVRRRPVHPDPEAVFRLANLVNEPRANPERRRAAIAIAATIGAPFVLASAEGTHADAASRRSLAATIRAVAARGAGVVVGSQDEILLAGCATHVLILEDGRVLAEGPPSEVMPAATAAARRLLA